MQENSDQKRQEFNLLLAQAKDALVETNFDEAESKYQAALEFGRALFSEPCSETVSCLVGLGDSYFAATKFEEARAAFLEALDEFERIESVRTVDQAEKTHDQTLQASVKIPALLKFAKTLTVLKEYSDADNVFAETVALAEPTLPLGNPILTGIYEAYANMLAEGKLDPGTEREEYFREKARVCRGKFTPPKRPPANVTRSDLPKLRRAEKPTAALFDGGGGVFLSPMVWLARNFKILLILLLVSVGRMLLRISQLKVK
ncbi:MAG: tetratricopeptide repeat protein [Cyanobacteria bacterium SZAS-4]|nr:tetratricopeptide repeat protein [Cyanobacteria bacterium SZAS-4]